MIRAASPPTVYPTPELNFRGHITHPAYSSPPQSTIEINATKALYNSFIDPSSL